MSVTQSQSPVLKVSDGGLPLHKVVVIVNATGRAVVASVDTAGSCNCFVFIFHWLLVPP